MPDNRAHHNETEMAEVNISTYRGAPFDLDQGVGYLCFNKMYPEHDYRVSLLKYKVLVCS